VTLEGAKLLMNLLTSSDLLVEEGIVGLIKLEFLKSFITFQKFLGLLLGSSSSINFLKLAFFLSLMMFLALLKAFL